jgi:hypothetical protein
MESFSVLARWAGQVRGCLRRRARRVLAGGREGGTDLKWKPPSGKFESASRRMRLSSTSESIVADRRLVEKEERRVSPRKMVAVRGLGRNDSRLQPTSPTLSPLGP